MFDVVALGESLIDFTPNGTNAQGIELFARNPGGAPANVLAMNAVSRPLSSYPFLRSSCTRLVCVVPTMLMHGFSMCMGMGLLTRVTSIALLLIQTELLSTAPCCSGWLN